MFDSMVSSKFILPLDALKDLVFKMHVEFLGSLKETVNVK